MRAQQIARALGRSAAAAAGDAEHDRVHAERSDPDALGSAAPETGHQSNQSIINQCLLAARCAAELDELIWKLPVSAGAGTKWIVAPCSEIGIRHISGGDCAAAAGFNEL